MLRLFICLVALFAVASAQCAIPSSEVKGFLDVHNKLRASISDGTYVAKNRTLPGAKTPIREMTWDCELEARAQKHANKCKFEHSERKGDGENVYFSYNSNKMTTKGLGTAASKSWESEFQTFGLKDTKLTMELFKTGVGHATQMAWAKSTKIGCGIAICSGDKEALVVCQYRDGGNVIGDDIYEH